MEKHSRKEDWVAILTGTFLVALGVFFLQSANLLTGGTTGLALLLSQFLPVTFGILY
ncbi:YitT family protein, partial [Vibrio sp. 10N.222.51.A6]